MAEYLYQKITSVPGLTGTSGERQSQYYQKLGSPMGNYTGSLSQNLFLLKQMGAANYGLPQGAAPASTATSPATPGAVTPFLNQVQQDEFVKQNSLTNPFFEQDSTSKAQIESDVRSKLEAGTPVPTAPNLEEAFNSLRATYGLSDIEANLGSLKNARRGVEAQTRQRIQTEEGQQVSMNVISGRVSETERQAREDLDFIDRQISYGTEQVQAGYNIINTVMSLKSQDFGNAMKLYETEFNKNRTIYEAVNSEVRDQRDFKQQLINRAEDTAKANLQTFANLVMKGNMRYSDLSAEQKLATAKLEVQSGLGIGFLSKLKISPQDSIISTSNWTDAGGKMFTATIVRNDDGSTRVENVFIGQGQRPSAGGSRSSSAARSSANAAQKAVDSANKAKADQEKAFWGAADGAVSDLRGGAQWGQVWNRLKAQYPGMDNKAIDMALGVPANWKGLGWEWWNKNGG